MPAILWTGPWSDAPTDATVLHAPWARGEPTRGHYDDEELAGWRKAALRRRKERGELWVVVHAGALPDWQIARGGWLDPDAAAAWGCWVERLGRALVDAVDGWYALADPLGEAACYDVDARRVGRALLFAQAQAWTHLRRGGQAVPVGALVRAQVGTVGRAATAAWLDAAASGRLLPPFGIGGELQSGGVLDRVGELGGGVAGAAAVPRIEVVEAR